MLLVFVIYCLKATILLFAFLLLYHGLFILPTADSPELRQNRLEHITNQSHDPKQQHLFYFIRTLARLTDKILDKSLGIQLVSIRALLLAFAITSFSYSMYKYLFFLFGVKTSVSGNTQYTLTVPVFEADVTVLNNAVLSSVGVIEHVASTLLISVVLIVLSFCVPRNWSTRRNFVLLFVALCSAPSAYASFTAIVTNTPRNHYRLFSGPPIVALSLLSDFSSITLTRWVMRKVASRNSLSSMFCWIAVDVTFLLLILCLPAFISARLPKGDIRYAGFAVAGANLTTALPTFLWFFLVFLLMVHTIFWSKRFKLIHISFQKFVKDYKAITVVVSLVLIIATLLW